jgi:hypothetical protein
MAYLAYAEPATAAGAENFSPAPPPEAAEPRLSALEWAVVALARRDSLASLRKPGRIGAAMAALFGARQNPRLTDPRLEAVRRISVMAWHYSYALPVSEIANFLKAGFSADQFEMLLASISRGRGLRKQRN